MLIKALCDYADAQTAKGADQTSPLFTEQSVSFRIMLTPEGEISSIHDIREIEVIKLKNGKEKERLCPTSVTLPKRTQKTGIDANIIEHRPLYIFGLNSEKNNNGEFVFSTEDKTDKARKSHEAFVKRNLEFCADIDSEVVKAYCRFIERWIPDMETSNPVLLSYIKEYSGAYYCFGLAGSINCKLEEDEQLLVKYNELCQSLSEESEECDSTEERMFCPIEGEVLRPARIHDKIRGIKDANATGAILVGMKEPAFESYGKKQSSNSGISEKAMLKYTAALNRLLADKCHRMFIEDMTIIYFAMSADDGNECDLFYQIMNGAEDESLDRDLCSIVSQIAIGKTGDLSALGITENVMFYVVGLAPNSSRISQKFCIRNGFGNVVRNILQHQADMAVKVDGRQVSVYQLLKELVSPKSTSEKVPPPLLSDLFSAILCGTLYPYAAFEMVIRRIKTDSDEKNNSFAKINDRRIGLIKAYLNRKARIKQKREEITMSLDRTNMTASYLCGRLFAVLENTQSSALGDLNRTIRDAYFSSACAKPSVVFPQLIKLSQNHYKKLQKEKHSFYIRNNKLQKEIMDGLNNEFPRFLSLEEQGKFIIGYYHQINDIFTKKTSQSEANLLQDEETND